MSKHDLRDGLISKMTTSVSLAVILVLTFFLSAMPDTHAASSQVFAQKTEVQVFTTPDESSLVIESIGDGDFLSPLAEMTGTGGMKWFMVKTRNGNVGWIKAGDNDAAKKVDSHFRSLPNENSVLRLSGMPESASKNSVNRAIAVPVRIRGSKVIVAVTFNNSVAANLLLDTGASRTMISTRIARDLRLHSTGSGGGYGIGGYVTVSTARMESVKTGEVEIRDLPVMVHDFSLDPSYEGLLGFDFLSRFQMSLDLQKGLLVLTPRKD